MSSIVDIARDVAGKHDMLWRAQHCETNTRGHMRKASNKAQFENIGKDSEFNCWEAIVFLGYNSIAEEGVQEKFREALAYFFETYGDSSQYVRFMLGTILQSDEAVKILPPRIPPARRGETHAVSHRGRPPIVSQAPPQAGVSPGDILFFYGVAHVALSLGGEDVASLWYGPDNISSLQVTTLSKLFRMIIADPIIFASSVKEQMGRRVMFQEILERDIPETYYEKVARPVEGGHMGNVDLGYLQAFAFQHDLITLQNVTRRVPDPFSDLERLNRVLSGKEK